MTQHRIIGTLIGLMAPLSLAIGMVAAPAQAASTEGVKGVVTLNGAPLKGATVTLLRTDDDSGDAYKAYKSATTSSKGAYSFSGYPLKGWIYDRVIVTDTQHRAVATERSFKTSPGKTAKRNVTMKPAGSISGKVTRADDSSPTATRVQIEGPELSFGPGGNEELVYRDEINVSFNGTYRFYGLPPGQYTVRYDDTARTYLSKCFDNIAPRQGRYPFCRSNATEVTVSAGATATPTAQQLDQVGAQIRGSVTNTSGTPLKGVYVTPVRTSEDLAEQEAWYAAFFSRSTGRFNLRPLESGDWQLKVDDYSDVWQSGWYDTQGITSRSSAKVYPLANGTTVKDVSIKLKSRAKVTVKTTPGTGRATFVVSVTRRATGSRPSGTVTISRGDVSKTVSVTKGVAKVTLTGLPSGKRTFSVVYRGTSSTANKKTTVTTRIK